MVFADPEHTAAWHLLADTLEQLGYSSENGTWRNFYLRGAAELRKGRFAPPPPHRPTSSPISPHHALRRPRRPCRRPQSLGRAPHQLFQAVGLLPQGGQARRGEQAGQGQVAAGAQQGGCRAACWVLAGSAEFRPARTTGTDDRHRAPSTARPPGPAQSQRAPYAGGSHNRRGHHHRSDRGAPRDSVRGAGRHPTGHPGAAAVDSRRR
ncbi:alkyl sulfatase dimerization domain-containing protein [Streptomyces kunmingensis]|uniref:alkyl sulfatase dimerization domain-containing protein n=1 Tax=Streptomyces kunmingensis TaxID=68225 RepID=UPI0031E39A77